MILTSASIKGGSGKTTIVANLITLLANNNKKVLAVDGDPQQSLTNWVNHRINKNIRTLWTTVSLKGAAIRSEINKLKDSFDHIVIDVGGHDSISLRAALSVTDKVLIPFLPRCLDIWTLEQIEQLILEAKSLNDKLIAYSIINCAFSRGSDNEDAKEILLESKNINLLSITIGQRKSFSNAMSEGKSVIETSNDIKARNEIKYLYDSIYI